MDQHPSQSFASIIDPHSDAAAAYVASYSNRTGKRLCLELDRVEITDDAIQVFTQGECHGLAAMLGYLLGEQMIVCGVLVHAATEVGYRILDINGVQRREEWIEVPLRLANLR